MCRDAPSLLDDPSALYTRLREAGCLYLPRLLDPTLVSNVGDQIREAMAEHGWLPRDPDGRPGRPIVARQEGSERWWPGYARVQAIEAFHELAHHPDLLAVERRLIPDAFTHPRKVANLLFPNFAVPHHQDYPITQGTVDLFTAWVPLVTLTPEAGRLLVRGRLGGRMLPLKGLPEAGAAIALDLPDDWQAYEYRAGDVVILHSLTVHAIAVNRSGEVALSCDYRFQSRRERVCVASLEPHHYPRVPGFRSLTRGWSSRRWIRAPRRVPRSQFVMPVSVESWHETLTVPPSRFVKQGDQSIDAQGRGRVEPS